MKTLFLDMEWGQIYGSYRRDFIPIEIGAVISSLEDDVPVLESKKFCNDIDIVIRKNIINDIGKTVGFSETVANIGKREYQKQFDHSYRLKKPDKRVARGLLIRVLNDLRQYIHSLFRRYHVAQIVLFGGREDLNWLKKANVNISNIKIVDIQCVIRKEIHYLFSLDKISLIIAFYSNNKFFGSNNFRYPLPDRYKYLIKPHRAIGDACRIFVVYKEFYCAKSEFVQQCSSYFYANQTHKMITNTVIKSSSVIAN
ncbi:hypothetical protein [Halotia branconii]|uniref:Uncharacterized protein n=1 Tax=Halotia branconii CENA392 TaxID=1539056 RepID=A0AAJ6NRQ4_9CYAN|nr:hypothetical protein [Halotia branconii]WGV25504.1 hypothetical protein QI031_27865 [Halotia branconii CENA392]